MKEDILEQVVDEYLQHKGYFTRHNIKFRPRQNHPNFDRTKDSTYSDIDVIAINPLLKGHQKVFVVSCKSWQVGFHVKSKLDEVVNNKIRSGRESWKSFRELAAHKWGEAFVDTVRRVTGSDRFTYIMAVTRVIGDRRLWETYKPFLKSLKGNPIKFIALPDMLDELMPTINTTLASSEIGRLLQVIKASGWLDSSK